MITGRRPGVGVYSTRQLGQSSRAGVPLTKVEWQRAVEAQLNPKEVAFLRQRLGKIKPQQLEHVMELAPEDAVRELRSAILFSTRK